MPQAGSNDPSSEVPLRCIPAIRIKGEEGIGGWTRTNEKTLNSAYSDAEKANRLWSNELDADWNCIQKYTECPLGPEVGSQLLSSESGEAISGS